MAQVGIIKVKKIIDALLDFVREDYLLHTNMQLSLVHTTPNSIGVRKVDTITVTGTAGQALIIDSDGDKWVMQFDTTINTTILNFITAYSTYFLAMGITLSNSTNKLVLTAQTAGITFNSPTVSDLKDESFLLRCFDDDDYIEEVSYKTLATEIFTRGVTEHRKVETRLMFDVDRATLPTIHVREPAKVKGKQDGIGNIGQDFYQNADGGTADERRRSFDSQYELMITSMNRHEVIIIEEVLLGLFVGAQDTLALQDPFYLINYSVKELIANNELVPNPLFIKAISLSVSYDKKYPDISDNVVLHKILFDQKILS